jgi:hypothetical protein
MGALSWASPLLPGGLTAPAKPARKRPPHRRRGPARAQPRAPQKRPGRRRRRERSGAATTADVGARRQRPPRRRGNESEDKTYTFGAMDVEGKLKTPQLLYFLNRVKLELDMSAPDKRSFMKELQQSADDKNL